MEKEYKRRVEYLELKVKSNSTEGLEYNTTYKYDTTVPSYDCNCPGFQFRRKCGHMELIDNVVNNINKALTK